GRPDPTGGTAALGGESAPARGYLLDNARAEAGERFVWLAELFDGVTRGCFDRLRVRAGSRCWEVGAGGTSIPQALAAAVGPAGHVLATDIDPSWMKAGDGYEVRRHDVAADPPPEPRTFDLVHARLVLVHVPDWARALATMAAALRHCGTAAGCWSRTPIPLCSPWHAWTTAARRSGGPTSCATRARNS
ncbi:methyltransferase, partial [Streptomyces sp. A475]|uniref:class I SAM-dependent methyltransferase n=1 Tax=Streptomyces sp. A475 TaxID=3131976 RepID=UPI0030C9E0F6